MSMDQRQRRREGSQRAQAARTPRLETRRTPGRRSRPSALGGAPAAAPASLPAILLPRDPAPVPGLPAREPPVVLASICSGAGCSWAMPLLLHSVNSGTAYQG